MDIAKEIFSLRTQLGLTQRQFADKVGIKQPQLARIESGKQLARLDTLKLIAEKCGYSVEIKLIPQSREQTAEEYYEELCDDLFYIEFPEEEGDEEVTNDDENYWVEYDNE